MSGAVRGREKSGNVHKAGEVHKAESRGALGWERPYSLSCSPPAMGRDSFLKKIGQVAPSPAHLALDTSVTAAIGPPRQLLGFVLNGAIKMGKIENFYAANYSAIMIFYIFILEKGQYN